MSHSLKLYSRALGWRRPALVTRSRPRAPRVGGPSPTARSSHPPRLPAPPSSGTGQGLTGTQVAQVPATRKIKARINQDHAADPAEGQARLLRGLVQVAPLDAWREKSRSGRGGRCSSGQAKPEHCSRTRVRPWVPGLQERPLVRLPLSSVVRRRGHSQHFNI